MNAGGTTAKNGGVQAGTVMVQNGLLLPEGVVLDSHSYSGDWRAVDALDGFAVDKLIRNAGWTFMFLGERADATVLGSGSEHNIQRAMARILKQVGSHGFNAVEVTGVAPGNFMGVPYVSVRAHARHIQKSHILQSDRQRKQA